MARTVIILRGAMGAGKSTLAAALPGAAIVSADHYFLGRQWSAERLKDAHEDCRSRFTAALAMHDPLVVVDNTNQKASDYQWYVETARLAGYVVHQVVVENRHGGVPTKPVPEHIVTRARVRIRGDLVL